MTEGGMEPYTSGQMIVKCPVSFVFYTSYSSSLKKMEEMNTARCIVLQIGLQVLNFKCTKLNPRLE